MLSSTKLCLLFVLGSLFMLTASGCFSSSPKIDKPNAGKSASGSKDTKQGNQAAGNSFEKQDQLNRGKPVTLKVDLWLYTPTLKSTRTKENPEERVAGQKIADAFTKLYPNVTIEWVRGMNKKDRTSLANYYTVKLSSGDGPDIGMSWNAFAKEGWYLPMDEYLNQPNPFVNDNRKWSEQFPEYLWSKNMVSEAVEGKMSVIGIPISLNSGSATAIFYNKEILTKEGIEVPKSYLEFIQAAEKLNSKGYIGLHPWTAQNQIYNWAFLFNLGPYYFEKNVADKLKSDKHGNIDHAEIIRGVKERMFSPVLNEYARELYLNFKKFFAVSPPNWESTDFTKPWEEGRVAMFEDGTWTLATESANEERTFEFGLFPPLPLAAGESKYVSVPKYTEKGPYQPEPVVSLNIIKPSVEKHGTEEAAVRFLQFLTAPENLSLLIEEDQTSIGAVKGVPTPALLEELISRPFPITPSYTWPTGLDIESNDQWNQYTTAWVYGKLTDEMYFAAIDEIQSKAADRIIQANNIDTSGWKMLLKSEGSN
ncbi:hypothetical protein Back11_33830 [Paenibacillus baekrokdamisoli]|uniref:Uncharacterized protein n=1 Tax=Paenibacillus baekrokdamisoli TaxID=1712516 RepID=A0A3G9JDG9_9BACL|nr:extracellular solute-binding protein [Paenibacillus baekrokdamisoli]MBB3073365.1 ABC-type glycerol-3-phosphate transport system substrate-binding protein [Paenibacillus baekrokdamisoli]BBH22038.1 hypothetical protein Back11_33830 [Paenibacillus baekrokdamisoli]